MPLLSRRRSARHVASAQLNQSEGGGGVRDDDEAQRMPDNASLTTVARPQHLTPFAPTARFDDQPPQRPVSEHGYHQARSSLSQEILASDIPDPTPPTPADLHSSSAASRSKRFSLMKLRNFSESHLPARARVARAFTEQTSPQIPAMAADSLVPAIVKTAPTMHHGEQVGGELNISEEFDASEHEPVRPSFLRGSPSRPQTSQSRRSQLVVPSAEHDDHRHTTQSKRHSIRWRPRGRNTGLEDLHRLSSMHVQPSSGSQSPAPPPAYGEETGTALALPPSHTTTPRFSESSRSDLSNGSSTDGPIYASTTTTTTTQTVSTQTTFFRLPRRNKNRNSLFPLPVKIPPPPDDSLNAHQQQQAQMLESPPSTVRKQGSMVEADDERLVEDGTLSPLSMRQQRSAPATPRPSTSALSARSYHTDIAGQSQEVQQHGNTVLQRRHTETTPTKRRTRHHPTTGSAQAALAKGALSFAEPSMTFRAERTSRSNSSATSSPLQAPLRLAPRERSSTATSLGQVSQDTDGAAPLPSSGRNSTSTTGRSSLGGLLNLTRFRQGSEPHSPRHGSPGTRSKSNSFVLSRDPVLPEREEGDTPGKYLERLEAAVSRGIIAGLLSKSADPFAQAVLRSYTRRFSFFGEPIDMSLRKLLLEAELPKETQQVDRVIQAFADRYHECNPGIFIAPDQAYIIAFSLMMLHTDAFNKNNKRKMQKADYIKNTSGQGPSDDILGCFYDNICYTPFVHYEEEVDINGERVLPFKPKRSMGKLRPGIPGAETVVIKKPAGPVDPYNLLVDAKLDQLRPTIKDTIALEDPYNYLGGQNGLDLPYLQRAFTHTGVLQIISARSRPAAYERQLSDGQPSPTDTQQGIVDLKVTKVGILWRKATKKKKARSPWQEWGAVLTGSQLYLFKNSHWAKSLIHQFNSQQKHGQPRTPVTFKPPLQDFKPDALIKTDNAVALVDATYTRHKNAFTFVRPGGQEEVLLAENDSELNDWLGLINYAAAFRAAGVRIRGMLGISEEDTRTRELKRLNSAKSIRSARMSMEEATAQNRTLSPQLQRQVMAARRQIMGQKISEMEQEITDAVRQLENMLRNARHLHVLAPIAPKTREDVVQAAGRADMMIQWLRRDIWRMKCHRDILAMDVRLDGLNASELEKLSQEPGSPRQPHASDAESIAPKEKPGLLTRLSSSRSAAAAALSTPQSPRIITSASRTSVAGSTKGGDVFHTPLESPPGPPDEAGWRFPNMQSSALTEDDQHRPSVASTVLSITNSDPDRRPSLSHASTHSSNLQRQRTRSLDASPSSYPPLTPVPTMQDAELLARTTFPTEINSERSPARSFGVDATTARTPEAKSQHRSSGVRRSLQKTFRDVNPHHHQRHGSTHKHRRGKDSESTVRSATGNVADEDELGEGTPGLTREKTRFILHGKQASVVQFGGDWERMKLRREQYERDHPHSSASAGRAGSIAGSTSDSAAGLKSSPSLTAHRESRPAHEVLQFSRPEDLDPVEMMLQARAASPVIHDLRHSRVISETSEDADETTEEVDEDDEGGDDDDDDDAASFREDAQAAIFYASSDTWSRTSSPDRSLSFVSGRSELDVMPHDRSMVVHQMNQEEEEYEYVDEGDEDVDDDDRRQTITGLTWVGKGASALDVDDDQARDQERGSSSSAAHHTKSDTDRRRTVLGPFTSKAAGEEPSSPDEMKTPTASTFLLTSTSSASHINDGPGDSDTVEDSHDGQSGPTDRTAEPEVSPAPTQTSSVSVSP